MTAPDIAREIREFVISNFLYGQQPSAIDDQQSFLESGIIDSTGVLELVGFIEQQYGIAIGDRELVPENLDSVANVSRFVGEKLAAQDARVAG